MPASFTIPGEEFGVVLPHSMLWCADLAPGRTASAGTPAMAPSHATEAD
jgi:hypothetical protein